MKFDFLSSQKMHISWSWGKDFNIYDFDTT